MALVRLDSNTYATDTADDTFELGRALGASLRSGDVIVLTGDLGAGKTQLTKGIAYGMGVDDDITSPTFTIGMTYSGAAFDLHHFDLYRLDGVAELEDTGILDVAGDDGVCVAEWGERYAGMLSDDRLDVTLMREQSTRMGAEPQRRVELASTGPRSLALVAELAAAVSASS